MKPVIFDPIKAGSVYQIIDTFEKRSMKKQLLINCLLFVVYTTNAQVCPVTISHVINGNQVQFFGSSNSNPSGWSWFFNGGTPLTSSQQNPVVTYGSSGQYIAALSVYGGPNNCNAALSSATDTIQVLSTSLEDGTSDSFGFSLLQNPEPHVELQSNRTQHVMLELKDMNGKNIVTIFNGILHAGGTKLSLGITSVPSGIYLLVLSKEDGILTRRLFIP